jgi:small subunit ribosomal protein S20
VTKRTQPEKRHRQSLKRKARNYAYRSQLRTVIKKARIAVENGSEDRQALVFEACRELDRMVTKGVVHKNTAARRKSRLMHGLHGKDDTGTLPIVAEAEPAETDG